LQLKRILCAIQLGLNSYTHVELYIKGERVILAYRCNSTSGVYCTLISTQFPMTRNKHMQKVRSNKCIVNCILFGKNLVLVYISK
jgi:hypothetical protein